MKTCITCGELCSVDVTTCPRCGEGSWSLWALDTTSVVDASITSIPLEDVSITVDDIDLKQASSIDLTGVREINGGLGVIVTSTPQPKKAKR